ncbi:MAG: hypothetical protein LBS35_09610 [Synergistaceae bacterium]|nr:hypothetical protein [Synergistaceae bacterium]
MNGKIIKGANFSEPFIVSHELGDNPGLYVVVDGAGGHNAGEAACWMILEELNETAKLIQSASEIRICIKHELNRIQDNMTSISEYKPNLCGMCATLAGVVLNAAVSREEPPCGMTARAAAAFFTRKKAIPFNCGDCRVYFENDRNLVQLTRDHSYVRRLFDEGSISEDAMRTHPQKNVVTAAVQAGGYPVEVYFGGIEFSSSGRFLICGDGVWEALPKEELERVAAIEQIERSAGEMAGKIMSTECKDNVSFILLDIHP